ncbi:NTP transferase domain-containing protein [Halomonas sp. LR3S48]|uniref:NTP transferase domain-containing protein n=1 Tax=Halomonas sp. LR3S48 TaxID=2982694 RepID=UPI0021E3E322|nr:NTP transferase domain-containing protein [Halomonas sp. LR3S48]UYG04738.1 NTP transferase domain-containing protein [Halomonas sp. LR3S48]
MPSDTVVALVLVAGRARRFGNGKRRAYLPGRGTLLAATLSTLSPHLTDIRVVLGIEDDPARLGIATGFGTIVAERVEQGMGESLAAEPGRSQCGAVASGWLYRDQG